MSLSLDFALFVRNSKTKLGLSLSERGILFTLAFRIGSHTNTWVAHDMLARECDILPSSLTRVIDGIVQTKIIFRKKNSRDKRRNLYLFNPLIKNYSQMNDEQKTEVHKKLNDEYVHAAPFGKNTSPKCELLSKDTSHICELNTSPKCELSPSEKTSGAQQPQGLQKIAKAPKEKEAKKKEKQSKRELGSSPCLQPYPEGFFPDDVRRELLSMCARHTNNDEMELLNKFETISRKYKTKAKDWQEKFGEFLDRELPKRVYEDESGKRKRYVDQPAA